MLHRPDSLPVFAGSSSERQFMVFRACGVLGLMSVLLLPGCKPSGPATDPAAEGGSPAARSSQPGRGLLVRPEQTSFAGKWGLVLTQPIPDAQGQPVFRDLCVALLELQESGDQGWTGTVLATLQNDRQMTPETVRVEGSNLEINFIIDQAAMDLQGQLTDGVVRGTLQMPDSAIVPVVLRPTNETNFEGWDPMPLAAGLDRFSQALTSRDQPQAMLDAANELRGTALSMSTYEMIVSRLGQFPNLDEATVRDITRDYVQMAGMWGPRLVAQSKTNAALGVAMTRRFPELALELADAAQPPEGSERADHQELLTYVREQATFDKGLRDIRSSEATVAAAAFESLQELFPKQRFNPELLEAIAVYAGLHDQKALARERLTDIVALPMMEEVWRQQRAGQPPGDPTPRERLLKLWEEEHDSFDGFDDLLTATYHKRMAELRDEVLQSPPDLVPADEQQRTVLVELFTGAGCGPCVAGDLALSALQQAYPAPQVVVLQYHEHIPAPDPLTNLDSEERLVYYDAQGTPMAYVDGLIVPPPGVAGLLQQVTPAYKLVRSGVDARLKTASQAKITLSARLEEGQLLVDAEAADFPQDLTSDLRLRLALVEDSVEFTGSNGIREHEFVVREMLGGSKGIGVKSGRLAYSLKKPLAKVREDLADYLKQFETGLDYSFVVKPLALERLSVVGWVQNDATREVLQAAFTPVSGSGATPPADAAPEATAPASAEQPANRE
jgi:thiol-disulfide isomerase/thioredoxin